MNNSFPETQALARVRLTMLHDLITAIKEAAAAWKRQRWLRHRRASIKDPFTN